MTTTEITDLLSCLETWKAASPEMEAVIDYECSQSEPARPQRRSALTVRELYDLVVSVATALRHRGLEDGDVVAVQLPNWHEFLVAHLAINAAGGVTMPISPIYRHHDLVRQLKLADATFLLIPDQFDGFDYVEMIGELRAELPRLRQAIVVGNSPGPAFVTWSELCREGNSRDLVSLRNEILDRKHAVSTRSLSLLNFSSGTTGEPKGVMHSTFSVSSCVDPTAERLELTEADVVLVIPTMGHGAGILNGLFLPLRRQLKVVYLDKWSASAATHIIAAEKITYAPVMPTYLFDLLRLSQLDPESLQSWVTARVSGGAISREIMTKLHQRLPQLRLCPGWGMSETLWSTVGGPSDPLEKRNTTEGRCVGDCRLQIRDSAFVQELPAGQIGEIVMKTSSLTIGYFNRPAITKESFTSDGWFKSGDLGYIDPEGYLVLSGRSKDLVIRGGENVPVVEIELLLASHPKVGAVAVVGVPDNRLGEKVCAVIESDQPDSPPTLSELCDYLLSNNLTKQFLPQYLLVMSHLPRTPVGKIKKQEVKANAISALAAH